MKELTIQERIEFLDMYARMASDFEYERKLDMRPSDIERYAKMLDVASPHEARRMHKRLKKQHEEYREAKAIAAENEVREAESIAQQRLAELERKRKANKPVKEVDVNAIREQDAERQRRWQQQKADSVHLDETWELPLEGTESQRREAVDRFRREIVYRGINFVRMKYDATPSQIKHEAARLGLKINWDIVRK